MKKIAFMTFCAMAAVLFTSCNSSKDYKSFVGTWGVEKIEYYNIDYAGNPIAGSMVTWEMTPGDPDDGIDLIFRSDKTGEMRDRSKDMILVANLETHEYDTIICPDTTIITTFKYSYDKSESVLYMDMDYVETYRMYISDLTNNSFIYENEYEKDYMERAYLKRLSNTTKQSASRSTQKRPHMPGSFLSGK
jgi:hypothetical protein